MNLRAEILKEHSRRQTDKIVRYVGNDPQRFAELVTLFFDGPYRVTQRAARPLSICVELHEALIKPHLSKVINNLKKPGLPDAVKRNTVRFLQFIDIPRKLQGKVADICFQYFNDTSEPVAVRVFSMTVLGNLAKENPDLKSELKLIIEDQMPYGSAGFISRAKKTLKALQK